VAGRGNAARELPADVRRHLTGRARISSWLGDGGLIVAVAGLLIATPVLHNLPGGGAVGHEASRFTVVVAVLLLTTRWRMRGAIAGMVAGTLLSVASDLVGPGTADGGADGVWTHLGAAFLTAVLAVGVAWHIERRSHADIVLRLTRENLAMSTQIEAVLQASEERFRSLVRHASDLMLILHADGTGRYVSASVQHVLGYQPEELLGVEIFALVHPDDAADVLNRYVERLGSPGAGPPFELRCRHRDGSWRYLECIINNRLDDPYVGGIIVNARDITERKRAEAELRESEERFRGLFENVPLGIFRIAPDGRLLLANPMLVQMLGYTSFDELTQDEGLQERFGRDTLAAALRSGEVRGAELEWIRHDGARLVLRMSARAVADNDGAVRYYEGTLEDITEQRRLAARLSQAERLSALGELAAGMAHEVNNPLAAVAATAELALRGDLPPRLREDLAVIHREASRAGEIVRSMLRFARQREPSLAPVQLASIAEEALSLRADRLSRYRVAVVREYAPAPDIMADRDQLLQVLINLINNSIDAMKPQGGGQIAVRIRPLEGGVELSVTDSGPGIPADVLDRIFDPFFTTKAPGEGTGLGLSISHRIVQEHHGTLTAENLPGGGACFRVCLPTLTPGQLGEPPRDGRRALIAVTDPMAADLLAEAARLLGFAPQPLAAACDLTGVAVAVLDPNAPDDLLTRLRAGRPAPRLVAAAPPPAGSPPIWDAILTPPYRIHDLRTALEGVCDDDARSDGGRA
jgi:PAS domain S-box-containing protein